MRVDVNHSLLRGATVLETWAFSNQTTKTEEFLLCFDNGKVLFVRSSAELESVIVLCDSIDELAEKAGDTDCAAVKWYEDTKNEKKEFKEANGDIGFFDLIHFDV